MKNKTCITQFDPENIKILPYREEGFYDYGKDGDPVKVDSRNSGELVLYKPERPEQGVISFNYYEEWDTKLYLPSENGVVPTCFIEDAKVVLEKLDEWMAYLEDNEQIDLDEVDLAWITIKKDDIELHFVGTRENAEVGAFFEKNDKGHWYYEGLG